MPRQPLPTRGRPGRRKQSERRASVRFTPAQEIICYWSGGGDFARARVRDLASGGACLVVRGPMEVGAELAVELINGPNTFHCSRRLHVMRIYQGNGRDSVIGGRFDHKLGYEEMLAFIV
jgi:hypothetical protein